MPKIVKPLTMERIGKAEPKGKVYRIFDGRNGMHVRITPKGRKYFIYRYIKPYTNTSPAEICIGEFPYMGLTQARRVRDQMEKELIEEGKDPRLELQTRELLGEKSNFHQPTVVDVLEFWRPVKKSQVKESTFQTAERMIERYIIPAVGSIPLDKLTIPVAYKALKFLDDMGYHETRSKVVNILVELVRFAVLHEMVEFNKLVELRHAFVKHSKTPNPTINAEELPALLEDMRKANCGLITKLFVKWILLTMVRVNEARFAEWSEMKVGKTGLEWHIPAEKMKGGRQQHIVPLSTQAEEILMRMHSINNGSKYVFFSPKTQDQPITAHSARSLLLGMGYGGRLTIHGLRALASTFLNDKEINGDVIEACLAHKVGGQVRRTYNRSTYLNQRVSVMQFWGDFVESCAPGKLLVD